MSDAMMREAERKFAEFLSQKSLKYTPQRRTVLAEAFRATGHFTADELFELARKHDRTLSKATLYRTLALLRQSGLLEEQDFGNGRRSYERLLQRHHHDHLICIRCKKILEFENDAIEKLQEEEAGRRGFKIVFHTHKLFGFCSQCAGKEP
jgi:Fur family ferric uptake transcriptional regulator